MLTRNEFMVLTELDKNENILTQRQLSEIIGLSLGLTNKTLKGLIEKNYIISMKVTEHGYDALEPYKVKRAIFIAAGFGSRLVPITLNTPKPLVRVHGKRMIETLLEAVTKIGIEDIIIVRGYLGDQFDVLLKEYPNIKFYDNNLFNEANNISSALLVSDKYCNSYVMDADLILKNPEIITKYQYQSNYVGVYKEKTDDWCLITKDKSLEIKDISIGGTNCYEWVGISYWTKEDGEKLAKDIPNVFNSPGGKERYWDQVPLQECKQNYKVYVRPYTVNDIVEIDSYSDLKRVDKSYV